MKEAETLPNGSEDRPQNPLIFFEILCLEKQKFPRYLCKATVQLLYENCLLIDLKKEMKSSK